MAQPVNTVDSYDVNGIREDLSDVIHDISPSKTPFYSTCAKTKVKNRYHEWQTDSLRSSEVNAHMEGDDTIADARTPTTRVGNRTQIFKNAVSISGTDKALDYAGRTSEMAYQVMKMAKEQKLDIEKALFSNTAQAAGASDETRYMAGLGAWIATNTNHQSGSSGADPTGDGTDARVDDGTPTAFSQTKLDDVLRKAWDSGGEVDTCYLNSFQMTKALTFTGMNNQRSTIPVSMQGKNRVANVIDVYMTPWGEIDFVMSRECRARDVFVLQSDMWKVGLARPTFNEPLAKTGDSDKRQVITELTLISCNEAASGGVFDNTVS